MSGVKGKSGRKPRHIEESKILDGLYPQAISVVKEILDNTLTAPNTRLEAALAVIYKKTGKPRIEIDQRVTGVIGLMTPDQLEQATRVTQIEEAKLIAQYSVEGGINAIQGQREEDPAPKREEIEAPTE